ncbi:hypothetical protein E2320_020872, partial [Naja naja]
VMPQMNIIAL